MEEDNNYGFFIKMLMRLSGGRITTPETAAIILIIISVLGISTSLFFVFRGPDAPREETGIQTHVNIIDR